MRLRAAFFVCALAFADLATAQTTLPAGTSGFPYTADVSAQNVNVRSQPILRDEFRCTQISSPTTVTVYSRSGEWLEIAAPPGTFGAVSKQFVQLDESRTTGTILGDDVRVYAGGDMRTSNFQTVLSRLPAGEKVKLLGEVGEFYKIVPPPSAHYWVHADYVQSGRGAAEIEVVATSRPAATEAAAPVPPGNYGDALKAFKAAQAALEEEYRKAPQERNLQGLLEQFQAIRVAPESSLKPYIDSRVLFLQNAIKQIESKKRAEQILQETASKQKEIEIKLTKVMVPLPPPAAERPYTAQGILEESVTFPGGPARAKRYLLREPTGRINAYVQCTSGAVDLAAFVGKLVGILGASRFDRDLETDLIEAQDVLVIREQVPPPPPPPTAKVKPKTNLVLEPGLLPPPTMPVTPAERQKQPASAPAAEPVPEPAAPAKAPAPEPAAPAPKAPEKAPAPEPAPEPKPVQPATTEPVGEPVGPILLPEPKQVEPVPAPAPESAPTKLEPIKIVPPASEPAAEPLPPTGLELVQPTSQPDPLDEKAYH